MKLVTNVHLTSPTGGLEMNVLQVSRELARRGHQVHLLYEQGGSLVLEYQQFCQSVTQVSELDYFFPVGHRARALRKAQLLPAIWAATKRRPDLIYGNRMLCSGWAIPAGALLSAPVVCHEHGYMELGAKRTAFLNRHVDRFIMISQYVADPWLAAGLDPSKLDVVHNGIDPEEYPFGGLEEQLTAREALGLPCEPFVVTYLGRLDKEKGVDVLLEAWRLLGWGPEEARLLVVGSSVTDHDGGSHVASLHALADEHVVFLPARRDVVTPLHASDVVVVPSIWDEPFGRSVIEALSTGRPVLASRVGGIPEILSGPLDRFLFERGNPSALAEQLAGIRDWRQREPHLAEVCAARVREAFTLARMVDGIESAFRSVT